MPRAVRFTAFGGPEVLTVVDIAEPIASAGCLVVEVRAAGVNPVETKIRNGSRGGSLDQPLGLGSDAAGVVTAVGTGAVGFTVGDRVMGFGLTGAYASHISGTAEHFRVLPETVSFDEGASLGVPVGTAYQVLKSLALTAGETLLVHSGSGAVGHAAMQFARLWGATVVATASEANHDKIAALGAVPVSYGPGLLQRVEAAAPQGVDLVLEAAGTREALDVSLALVAERHRIGEIVKPDWAAEFGVTVFSGGLPGSIGAIEKALRVEAMDVALTLLSAGTFTVEIGSHYALDEVREAAAHSATGHVRGKIILVP